MACAPCTQQVAHADGQGITIYVYLRPGASAPGIIFVITFDESYSVVVESNKNSLSFVCRTNAMCTWIEILVPVTWKLIF